MGVLAFSIIEPMQRRQAFKYELRPDGQQERQMRRFAGSCRFVFNKALALQKMWDEANNTRFSYKKLANLLPEWILGGFPPFFCVPSNRGQQ